jgi:hypothetical protein
VFNGIVEHYYGIKGTTSVYNPKIGKDQSSAGHLFIQNENGDATNKIIVGWHVSFYYSITIMQTYF